MNERFHRLDTAELSQAAHAKRWIWDGLLAPGQITLFTSMWKSGKTTLLSHLLAQRKAGGMLGGRAVAAGVSAVISEEPATLWHERNLRLGFGPRDCFFCRPFVTTPSASEWLELLDHIKELQSARGIDLLLIDPLMYFLPARDENHARLLLEALLPLRDLAQAGIAVLLAHHPRKAAAREGMASRGSGALPAFVDTLIEMYKVAPDDVHDRRRRLVGFSRDPATPRSLLIELNEQGTGYSGLEEAPEEDEFRRNWQALRIVFEDADHELSRQEVLAQWPSTYPPPHVKTLWRWLNEAVQRGLLQHTGAGRRADPYRYFLAEKMAHWHDDPLYTLAQTMRADAKLLPPASYDAVAGTER